MQPTRFNPVRRPIRVAILTAVTDIAAFKAQLVAQFQLDPDLGIRVLLILRDFFRDHTSPGLLVYSEHLAANLPADPTTPERLQTETERARRTFAQVVPSPEFFAVAAVIEYSTTYGAPLVNEYLSALENARISVTDNLALESLPAGAFSGAYSGADTLVTSAAAPVAKLSEVERDLLKRHLESRLRAFQMNQALRNSYLHTLGNQG